MKSLVVAIVAFSALAAASPVQKRANDPRAPVITAAPSSDNLMRVLKRQEPDSDYTDCTIASDTFQGTTEAFCTCQAETEVQVTSTTVSGIPSLICGDATTTDGSQPTFTSKPSVVGNEINFGELNPSSFLATYLASLCSSGCPTTGSTTVQYVDSGVTPSPGVTTSNTDSAVYAEATDLAITWSIDDPVLLDNNVESFFNALSVMEANQMSEEWFDWEDSAGSSPTNEGGWTNYRGMSQVGIQKYSLIEDQQVINTSVSVSFTSKVTGNALTCGDIEGPIAAAFGAIPDFGFLFGVLGSIFCAAQTTAD